MNCTYQLIHRQKIKDTIEKVSKQLVFLCYYLCSIRNKFINNAKRDLRMYLDSTRIPNSTINTLVMLGLSITFCIISYNKDTVSKKHSMTVKLRFSENANNTIILNIDGYHTY